MSSAFRRRDERICSCPVSSVPFISVAQYYDHMAQELHVELNRTLDEYEAQFGTTLTDRIVNRFKNRPLIAFVVIVIAVVIIIGGFVATVREI